MIIEKKHKIKEPREDPYLCDSAMDVSCIYDFRQEVTFHRVPHKLPRLAGLPGRMSHKPQIVRVAPPGVHLVTMCYCHLSINCMAYKGRIQSFTEFK